MSDQLQIAQDFISSLTNDPTPREIAQTCREIQAQWDDATREDRAVVKHQGYKLRVVPVNDELRELMADDDE